MRTVKYTVVAVVCAVAGYVYAQCSITRPTTPPLATQAVITLPPNGGTVGCTLQAFGLGGTAPATAYPVGNAKCATVVSMAQQAIANDNGWNDGGLP